MSYTIYKEAKPQIKAILFDMDGVIIDSEKLYVRFWKEAANKLGYNMTHEEALGLRSSNRIDATNYLKKLYGNDVSYDAIRNLRIKLMDEFINTHGIEAKKGVKEILDYLDLNNIPRVIVTSSPIERVKAHLGYLNILNRFDKICTAYEVKRGKPHPDIYLYAAKCLNLDPNDCLAIEDSPSGINSAASAKANAIIIPDQDEPTEDILNLCYGKADSLLDLINLIEKIK